MIVQGQPVGCSQGQTQHSTTSVGYGSVEDRGTAEDRSTVVRSPVVAYVMGLLSLLHAIAQLLAGAVVPWAPTLASFRHVLILVPCLNLLCIGVAWHPKIGCVKPDRSDLPSSRTDCMHSLRKYYGLFLVGCGFLTLLVSIFAKLLQDYDIRHLYLGIAIGVLQKFFGAVFQVSLGTVYDAKCPGPSSIV